MNFNFKKLIPHIIVILFFIIINIIYFLPQFQGKTLYQGDIVNHIAMSKEATDFQKATGEVTLWTNSMFGGMPTYQISAPQQHNYLKYIRSVLELGFSRPTGYFIMGMISFYILFLILGFNVWISAIGAFAFGFLTNNIFLFEAGHMTKIMAIMLSPLVLAGVVLSLRKKYIWGGLLFAIAMGLELLSNHIQMTYYLGIIIGILVLIEFIDFIKKKDYKPIAISLIIFVIGIVLALGSSASKLWTTYEYSKDTMRGKPILKSEGKAKSSSETKGLEWNYAMNWSNGVLDLVSTFIPGVVGGGSSEKVGKNTDFAKKYRRAARRNLKTYIAPLYWGKLPFTSGPPYMGALIFFLFILGLFVIKGKYKWWALISVVLLYLLSMGKNLEFFNRLFYDYFPLYNKFRTPNSIMGIAAVPLVFLSIYTLKFIAFDKYDTKSFIKKLWIAFGIVGIISLFFAIAGTTIFDFSAPNDSRYIENGFLSSIISARKSLMISDSFRTLIIVALGTGIIWAFVNKKISQTILLSGIGLIILFDILNVDSRYISHDDFVKKTNIEKSFTPREVDKQILADDDPYFRVMDLTVDPFNNAKPSYFFKNVGGYHAAKLQRYQDIIDRYLGNGYRKVLNMLNTKYIIQKQGKKEVVAKNPEIMGNAWFVKSIKKAADANEEIDLIKTTDIKNTAIVHREFDEYTNSLKLDSVKGHIVLTDYAPNKLIYDYTSDKNGFVVFSDIWYGPNKGWYSYIDDKPAEHIRTDYIFRGMKVPAGSHKIVFEFKPRSYYLGEKISLFSSLIMILGLLVYAGYYFYRKKDNVVVK
jgi:hypothetical protein